MTVKFKKSSIDIRQAVDVSSKSSGANDIATSTVTRDHIGSMETDLIPLWTHWTYTGGGEPEDYAGITDGGRTVIASNGNNGPAIQARMGGTAKGDFEISWTPGYTLGWSAMQCVSVQNYHDGSINNWAFEPTGDKRLWIANNNSNNQSLIQYWDGIVNKSWSYSPGLSGANFKMWRLDGKIKIHIPGQSVFTVPDAWNADLVFLSGNQSPHSTTINSAGKLSK